MSDGPLPQSEIILYQTEEGKLVEDSVIRKLRITAADGDDA